MQLSSQVPRQVSLHPIEHDERQPPLQPPSHCPVHVIRHAWKQASLQLSSHWPQQLPSQDIAFSLLSEALTIGMLLTTRAPNIGKSLLVACLKKVRLEILSSFIKLRVLSHMYQN